MSIYIGNDLEDRLEALEMENTSLKDRLKPLEIENASLKKAMNTTKLCMKSTICQTCI